MVTGHEHISLRVGNWLWIDVGVMQINGNCSQRIASLICRLHSLCFGKAVVMTQLPAPCDLPNA